MTSRAFLFLSFALAVPAAAQIDKPPIAPQACETPEDVAARVHYERALRAQLDGRDDEALREAQAAVDAGPQTRFAEAARRLGERIHSGATKAAEHARSTGVGPRTELVITATTAGLYVGGLAAAAADADGKGTVALVMAGTGLGLAASLAGSAGRHVPQSMPQMLQTGLYYGTFASLMVSGLADIRERNIASAMLAGTGIGIAGGLLSAPWLTGGDSGAATTGMIYGAALPVLVYTSIVKDPSDKAPLAIALAGGTAGMLGAIVYNHELAAFSRGRWNLITLGGGVGALMGAGVGVLTDAFEHDARAGLAVLTAGTALGLGLTWWLTGDFGADEPHPGAASLIEYENGKLAVGNVLSSVAPTGKGAYVSALSARF